MNQEASDFGKKSAEFGYCAATSERGFIVGHASGKIAGRQEAIDEMAGKLEIANNAVVATMQGQAFLRTRIKALEGELLLIVRGEGLVFIDDYPIAAELAKQEKS